MPDITDHDLLITLIAEVRQMKEQIRELSDNTKDQIVDHETRLRELEANKWKTVGIGIAVSFCITLGGVLVTIFFH